MKCDRPRAVLEPAKGCALSNTILVCKLDTVAFALGSVGDNVNDGVDMTLEYYATRAVSLRLLDEAVR